MSYSDLEHDDAVIGRALDALDDLDHDVVDLADDTELLEYREVLSHLPFAEVTPRAGLEDRVIDAALAARAPSVPMLVSRRRVKARLAVLGSAAAVAAIVTAVLVFGHNGTDRRGPHVQIIRALDQAEVARLRGAPDAHDVELRGATGAGVGRVVVANGEGALYGTSLDAVPGTSYWFWVSGDHAIVRVGPVDSVRGSGLLFQVRGPMTNAFITSAPTGVTPERPGPVVGEAALNAG